MPRKPEFKHKDISESVQRQIELITKAYEAGAYTSRYVEAGKEIINNNRIENLIRFIEEDIKRYKTR